MPIAGLVGFRPEEYPRRLPDTPGLVHGRPLNPDEASAELQHLACPLPSVQAPTISVSKKMPYMLRVPPAAQRTHQILARLPYVPVGEHWLLHQMVRKPIQRTAGLMLAVITPPNFAVVTHEGRPNCAHFSRSGFHPAEGGGDERSQERHELRQNLQEWRKHLQRYQIINTDEFVWISWAQEMPVAYSLDEVKLIFYRGAFSRYDMFEFADHVVMQQGCPSNVNAALHLSLRQSLAGVPGAPTAQALQEA